MLKRFLILSVLFLGFVSAFTSCNDDEPTINPQAPAEDTVNGWIYNLMTEVYFWEDQIPANINKDLSPTDFFKSLLFNGDRFSALVPDYQELINSLNGIELETGYEFSLVQISDTDNVEARIRYVKPNSPASNANLQRGDIITAINSQNLNINNYQSLLSKINQNHTITFYSYSAENNAYQEQEPVEIAPIEYSEKPIFLDSVLNIDSRKVGYLVYNFFSNGPTDTYDQLLNQAFQNFKNSSITDLVIDLRYNRGGTITSATRLASLIVPNITSNHVFYRNEWNDLYQNYWEDQNDESQLRGYFTQESENIGSMINGNVYILTGNNTASASELVINGLDPFMNVTLIGQQTVGKNVGSIPFEDEDNPENKYGALPIVIRLANSDGYSSYENGFTPLGENFINEIEYRMVPFGNIEEPLLSRALELITGSSTGGRKNARLANQNIDYLGSSSDNRLKSEKTILNNISIK